jgi:VWFA-related protein
MPHASRAARTRLLTTTLAAAFGVCTVIVSAQTLSPGEVRLSSHPYQPRRSLRLESRLVQLEVVVRDKRGRAVPGLGKDDFGVLDSGNRRELTAFSVDQFHEPAAENTSPHSRSPVPGSVAQPTATAGALPPKLPSQNSGNDRWIALLLDDINTAPGDLAHAKIAASRFIKESLESGDRIAVFVTSAGQAVPFTKDPAAILAAMTKVQSHPRLSPGGLAQCPRITAYEAYQIVNNDPTAMKAKVEEACACGGGEGCQVEGIPGSSLLNPTSVAGSSPYGGAGTLSSIIDSVHAQAQQTWDQAHFAAQATLDAIKSSLDQLGRMPGKRILLLASSGFLSGTLDVEQDSIVNEALRDGVVIDSLDAKGLYAEAPGTPLNETVEVVELPVSSTVFQITSLGDRLDDLDSAMARFAESTGGLLFRNNNDLDLGFRQLGLLPACTYLLGFTPAEDGRYHRIKVELKNASHDFVQVRPGYFAPNKATIDQPSPTEKMDSLMSATDEKTELPATISEKLGTTSAGGPQLTIQTHIDIQRLPFEQQNDRHVQKLIFVAALFDSGGNFVTGKQADMELALKPESFDRLSGSGINGVMQLEVPAGRYRLRVVVQESLHGTLSATAKNLQIP